MEVNDPRRKVLKEVHFEVMLSGIYTVECFPEHVISNEEVKSFLSEDLSASTSDFSIDCVFYDVENND